MDFFAIPKIVIDSGLWALMKPSERAVYTVLCKYRNYNTDLCYPGIKSICGKSGVHKNKVCIAIKKLCVYGLIEKWTAPKSLKFRNIYRVIMNPELDPRTFPQKTEKKCKQNRDERSGKYVASLQNTETDTCPLNAEAVSPQKTEKKESKKKEKEKRDSKKTPLIFPFSKKTINEILKEKGKDWLVQNLRTKGYSEDQINSSINECNI